MVRKLSLTKKQRLNTNVAYLVGRDGFVLTSAERCQPDRRTCNDVVRHRSSMVRKLSLTKKQRLNTDVVYLVGRDGFVLTSAERCQPDRRTCNDVVRHRSSMVRKLSLTKKQRLNTNVVYLGGQGWIRTIEDIVDGFTVRCIWPLCNLPKTKNFSKTLQKNGAGERNRTFNLLITSQLLYH